MIDSTGAAIAARMTAAGGTAGATARAFMPSLSTKDPQGAAEEFVGLFYSMMISEMQKTVPQDDYFGGKGEEIFRSLWVNEVGSRMAKSGNDQLVKMIMGTRNFAARS